MSSQKGNVQRTRPQKYQNRHVFQNNLYDKSQKTKAINNIQVCNVCERCKKIIEWKIKYKKFKPLKAPTKCAKCDQKVVKHAYHMMCGPCAKERDVCPKCGVNAELVEAQPTLEEQIKLDAGLQAMLKALPERKRRTFLRYVNQNAKKIICTKVPIKKDAELSKISEDSNETTVEEDAPITRENLLDKLKSLSIKKENELDSDLDFSDDEFDLLE